MGTGNVLAGVAKQTALGSPAAAPAYTHGLESGGLKIDPTQEVDKLTSASLSPTGVYRSRIESEASFTTRAFYKSLGLYLLAMLGSCTTTGTSPTYTHEFVEGGSVPYLTFFSKEFDGLLTAIQDGNLAELSLEWDENNPLTMTASGPGGAFSIPSSFTASAQDEVGSDDYFTPVGGLFKYDIDGASPAAADILGGSITMKRNTEAKRFSGSLEAGDMHMGGLEVTVTLKITPTDTAAWRTILTGAVNGTSAAATPLYGSLEISFDGDGTNALLFEASRVAFSCEKPEADPENGPVELDLVGLCLSPGGVTPSPVTITLTNGQASY